jgi:hypothetical protein
VAIVEKRSSLAADSEAITRSALVKMITAEPRVVVHLGCQAERIEPAGVWLLRPDGQKQYLEASATVLAVGVVANRELREAIDSEGLEGFEVHEIGDCASPAGIASALEAARVVGCQV